MNYLKKSRQFMEQKAKDHSVLMNASKIALTLKSEKGKLLTQQKSARTIKPVAPAKKRVSDIEAIL